MGKGSVPMFIGQPLLNAPIIGNPIVTGQRPAHLVVHPKYLNAPLVGNPDGISTIEGLGLPALTPGLSTELLGQVTAIPPQLAAGLIPGAPPFRPPPRIDPCMAILAIIQSRIETDRQWNDDILQVRDALSQMVGDAIHACKGNRSFLARLGELLNGVQTGVTYSAEEKDRARRASGDFPHAAADNAFSNVPNDLKAFLNATQGVAGIQLNDPALADLRRSVARAESVLRGADDPFPAGKGVDAVTKWNALRDRFGDGIVPLDEVKKVFEPFQS
jgi:hypothetical protein